jgi:hypothetical protein
MGPESSGVKVKDLAQEGLILVTIFEAELSAITFCCAPEQPILVRQETRPGRRLVARALGYGIRLSRVLTVPSAGSLIGRGVIGDDGPDAPGYPLTSAVSTSGQLRSVGNRSQLACLGMRRARRNGLDPENVGLTGHDDSGRVGSVAQ